jgi:hypothetical protein
MVLKPKDETDYEHMPKRVLRMALGISNKYSKRQMVNMMKEYDNPGKVIHNSDGSIEYDDGERRE